MFNAQKYLIIISLIRLIHRNLTEDLIYFQSSFSSTFTTFSCLLLIWTSPYLTILRNFTNFKRSRGCRTWWWLFSRECMTMVPWNKWNCLAFHLDAAWKVNKVFARWKPGFREQFWQSQSKPVPCRRSVPPTHICSQHQPAGKVTILQVLPAGVPYLLHMKVLHALHTKVKWPSSIVAACRSPGHLQELEVHPEGME